MRIAVKGLELGPIQCLHGRNERAVITTAWLDIEHVQCHPATDKGRQENGDQRKEFNPVPEQFPGFFFLIHSIFRRFMITNNTSATKANANHCVA